MNTKKVFYGFFAILILFAASCTSEGSDGLYDSVDRDKVKNISIDRDKVKHLDRNSVDRDKVQSKPSSKN